MLRLMIAAYFLLAALAPSATAEGEVAGVRDRRYCEILIVRRTGLKLEADVYNTLGLNDCPQAQWAAIDPAKIKHERHALTIVMNGPRHFVMDRIVIERRAQPPAEFQGLMMNFLAVLHVPWRDLADRTPYVEHKVSRSTRFSFDAGEPVYELISPSGDVYVMQSYSEIVDSSLRMADLQNLGSRLKLPAGWTFRTRILSAPLAMIAAGEARSVQDDFENTYQSMTSAEHAPPKE
jgi:hypothetical protein